MPSWAYKVFERKIGGSSFECEKGSDFEELDLVFVIDGVDYRMPKHHWMQVSYKDKDDSEEVG
jgi:hypothetical protein